MAQKGKPTNKSKFDWLGYLKGILITLLKNHAMKFLLGKLVNIALLSTTWQIWIAKFIVEFAFDKIVIPLLKELELEGRYKVDVIDGKKRIKLIDKAKEDNNEDAYNSSIDDI